MTTSEPGGCRWCGVLPREHITRWADAVGYHKWTVPTSDQIRERMFARRRWQVYKRRGIWHAVAPRQRGKILRLRWRYATWAEAIHRATVTGITDTYIKAG